MLHIGGGGELRHHGHEDGCHHQHGRQVGAQGCLEVEGLDEDCRQGDHHEWAGGDVRGQYLLGNFPLESHRHHDPIFWTGGVSLCQGPVGDDKRGHVKTLVHDHAVGQKLDSLAVQPERVMFIIHT